MGRNVDAGITLRMGGVDLAQRSYVSEGNEPGQDGDESAQGMVDVAKAMLRFLCSNGGG